MHKKTLAFVDVNGTEANAVLRDYLQDNYGADERYDLCYVCDKSPNDAIALLGESCFDGVLVPYDASLGFNVIFNRLIGQILADPHLYPLIIITNPNQLDDGLEFRNWLYEATDAASVDGHYSVTYRTLNFLDARRGFASNADPSETGLAPFEDDIDNFVYSSYDI